jgi:hypothetical protein
MLIKLHTNNNLIYIPKLAIAHVKTITLQIAQMRNTKPKEIQSLSLFLSSFK